MSKESCTVTMELLYTNNPCKRTRNTGAPVYDYADYLIAIFKFESTWFCKKAIAVVKMNRRKRFLLIYG